MRIVLAASAAILLAAGVLAAPALAQEHPKGSEHPKGHEHPQNAEHPKAQEHSQAADKAVVAGDIVTVAAGAGNFKTLVSAIAAAGLTEKLKGEGPFTVFAPTDEAFAKLPKDELARLLEPAGRGKLAGILACHVLPAKVMAADVKTMKAKTIGGHELSVAVADGHVTVDGARVVETDIVASNGVIHAIDAVVLPGAAAAAGAAKPADHPRH